MHPIIKKLLLAGLMTLPAACATYPGQYYSSTGQYSGSSYGYAYPGQYQSGYGVIERNYYNNTYAYPTPVYRGYGHQHHRDHDHDDNRYRGGSSNASWSNGYANSQQPRRHHGSRAQVENANYNWNGASRNAYSNQRYARDGRRDGRQGDGHPNVREHQRHDNPNAQGQWQQQRHWNRQDARRQHHASADPNAYQQESMQQNPPQRLERGNHDRQGHKQGRRFESQTGQ